MDANIWIELWYKTTIKTNIFWKQLYEQNIAERQQELTAYNDASTKLNEAAQECAECHQKSAASAKKTDGLDTFNKTLVNKIISGMNTLIDGTRYQTLTNNISSQQVALANKASSISNNINDISKKIYACDKKIEEHQKKLEALKS